MASLNRILETQILQSLEAFPAVYIAGPRQSGKSTLSEYIASKKHKARYITFDDIQMRASVQHDPDAFLQALDEPVVLDEVQRVPELFLPLKMCIDKNRACSDGERGQFLLTGSVNIMVLPTLSDALVGRMALHTLLPFIHR